MLPGRWRCPRIFMRVLAGAFMLFCMLAGAAGLARAQASFPDRPIRLVVAFSPGAQDTMMVLALALNLDPVFVGAHHVARFLVVTITVAIAARRLAKKKKK